MIDQHVIFGPVLALLVLKILVWITLFVRRIPWINSANLTPEQFRPGEFEKIQPEAVLNPSSNFKNLFEVPIIFYVLAGYLFLSESVDMIYFVGSWLFVLTRYAHSFIHCTFNHVLARFGVYALGTAVVFLMVLRATAGYFLNV